VIFYHGTSRKKWKLIKKEGVLWGYNIHKDENGKPYRGYRYTYLTPHIEVTSMGAGNIILEIEYDPVGVDGTGTDNYGFDPPEGQTCWQFSVFVPIPISKVKKMKIIDILKKHKGRRNKFMFWLSEIIITGTCVYGYFNWLGIYHGFFIVIWFGLSMLVGILTGFLIKKD